MVRLDRSWVRALTVVVSLGLLTVARDAHAAFHLMKVVEVYPGSPAAPAAQYVALQMFAAGQNIVGGTSVAFYDASDVELGRFTFAGSVPSSANQAKILIATTQAQTFFGVTADLTMTNLLVAGGGKVCFEAGLGNAIDCVAWGSHPGSGASGGAGDVGAPASPLLGLRPGRALVRRLDVAGSPTVLEGADDTSNSATDWQFAAPAPRTNAGQAGTIPSSSCGNSVAEGVEGCDDGNTMSGDGCSAVCHDEGCGDLVVNDVSETCDDGNAVNGDGCDRNCRVTGCGNGIITAGEVCDDGNLVSGDGCDRTCRPTGCGSGVVTGTETCDDGNLVSGDGCDANCTVTGCGNGIVTAGEDCEPPGVGACDATCQLLCDSPADCADSDPCTTNERCLATGCAVDPVPVDDGEACTADACGPGGVTHTELPDGMTCTLTGMAGTRALCVGGTCVVARCGDGFTDVDAPGGAEQCDDGNATDTDGCTNQCTTARCGDGIVHAGEEACDDGDPDDTDACTTACEVARCGDGFVGPDETCDDDNTINNDGCSSTCATERCGDAIRQLGEACDDGNAVGGDGCSATCEVEDAPPVDGGGCCRTGGSSAPPALVGLAVLALLGRRRRR